ncbi:hypothetical protein F5884DRAFT_684691 [Xylogone sp. PMI_703]|nr:hypothetical protein F5884DRAFT_684691 [Xylogone sp. PMI_703]
MSLPPVAIHVKRKATDEPVDFLRVHETSGKRQRREVDFVFSRQALPQTEKGTVDPNVAPEDARPIKPLKRSATPALQPAAEIESRERTPEQLAQLRRFHISRNSASSDIKPSGIRKRAASSQPTVFVERTPRQKLKHLDESPKADQNVDYNAVSIQVEPPKDDGQENQVRPQKKPGLAARRSVTPLNSQTASPAPKPRLPSSFINRSDADLERLVQEMQAYTLQSIGADIAVSGQKTPEEAPSPRKPHSTRFKPRKPALRYKERHPEEVNEENHPMEEPMDAYEELEDDEDTEYIIDTYYRVPADVLESKDGPQNIGLLILDSQPDIDEFYIDGSDSEEEEDDEDEDENAENHYTADYPDEEVASDDEYDIDPYRYRTHNASDLEEYDIDDAVFSDEDTEISRQAHPWSWQPRAKAAKTGLNLDDL